MYQQVDTLSENQKGELQNKIKNIRQLLAQLRQELNLDPKVIQTGHSIASHSSLLWEMLTELNSRGLQAYGTVPPDLTRYLDPIGESLTEQMSAIGALLSQPTDSPTHA